jgi:hypothetical protein
LTVTSWYFELVDIGLQKTFLVCGETVIYESSTVIKLNFDKKPIIFSVLSIEIPIFLEISLNEYGSWEIDNNSRIKST